jgi:hypothetical protein
MSTIRVTTIIAFITRRIIITPTVTTGRSQKTRLRDRIDCQRRALPVAKQTRRHVTAALDWTLVTSVT